ncbi:MAG: acireductone synthase [Turneriella sp.]
MKLSGVICDIEGTTSSISFVHKVLFPLSLERMDAFLQEHRSDQAVLAQLGALGQKLYGDQLPEKDLVTLLAPVLKDYIIKDVKDTTLKWLQGKIWKEAFESGAVKGHVYPDVPGALRAWYASGLKLFIYSSGSVEAQQLLFRYSEAGDLTSYFSGYFDTTTGGKREGNSYAAIAAQTGFSPRELLFLSDVVEELSAAESAGVQTCLLLREGATAPPGYAGKSAADFNEVHRLFFA